MSANIACCALSLRAACGGWVAPNRSVRHAQEFAWVRSSRNGARRCGSTSIARCSRRRVGSGGPTRSVLTRLTPPSRWVSALSSGPHLGRQVVPKYAAVHFWPRPRDLASEVAGTRPRGSSAATRVRPLASCSRSRFRTSASSSCSTPVDELLGFRDLLRGRRADRHVSEAWEALDTILENGSSAWRVRPDREQLVRHVDDAVQQIIDAALQQALRRPASTWLPLGAPSTAGRLIPGARTTRPCLPSRPW